MGEGGREGGREGGGIEKRHMEEGEREERKQGGGRKDMEKTEILKSGENR